MNAYVEPVVSLDLDIVVAVEDVEAISRVASERDLKVEHFAHSVNLTGEHRFFVVDPGPHDKGDVHSEIAFLETEVGFLYARSA